MSYLLAAALFLIQVFFNAFIVLFLVRTLLIAVGAAFSNPFCRFVYQLTNPVITPLRRAVPRWGRIELASLLVAYVLALVEFALMLGLAGALPSLPSLLLHALADLDRTVRHLRAVHRQLVPEQRLQSQRATADPRHRAGGATVPPPVAGGRRIRFFLLRGIDRVDPRADARAGAACRSRRARLTARRV
jgi:uncharacterized protein YggT (Ycf19 family)